MYPQTPLTYLPVSPWTHRPDIQTNFHLRPSWFQTWSPWPGPCPMYLVTLALTWHWITPWLESQETIFFSCSFEILYTRLETLLDVGVGMLAQQNDGGWKWLGYVGMENVAILGRVLERRGSSAKVSTFVYIWSLYCCHKSRWIGHSVLLLTLFIFLFIPINRFYHIYTQPSMPTKFFTCPLLIHNNNTGSTKLSLSN